MRVHLRNVVHSAIERGLVVGYHRVNKLTKPQQKDMDVVVDTMLKSVWECLDGIIDFRDDDEEMDDEKAGRPQIGFQSVDAVSNEVLPINEDDESEDIVPLDILYRIPTRTLP